LGDAVGDQVVDAIRLATTELVTNAVRHGGLRQPDRIELIVDVDDDMVRVQVEQPTSAAAARVVESPGIDGGFGLAIVDSLSERWGVSERAPARVWCEIPTT
jgi:anti-sigma regulatory factor (Ser/Thr protein kinase)